MYFFLLMGLSTAKPPCSSISWTKRSPDGVPVGVIAAGGGNGASVYKLGMETLWGESFSTRSQSAGCINGGSKVKKELGARSGGETDHGRPILGALAGRP